jgi:hypothetical protein
LIRSFTANDMPCRRLDYSISYKDPAKKVKRYALTWCKTADGDWKIVETPAPAAGKPVN